MCFVRRSLRFVHPTRLGRCLLAGKPQHEFYVARHGGKRGVRFDAQRHSNRFARRGESGQYLFDAFRILPEVFQSLRSDVALLV